MACSKPAVQLYTLRNELAKDFSGVCWRVAGLGYRGAELTDMRGEIPAKQLRQLGADIGLTWLSVHVPLEALENQLPAVMDYYAAAGIKTIVCPWLPPERRLTYHGWLNIAHSLTHIGRILQSQGFVLAYHHHDFEFAPVAIPDSHANDTATTNGLNILLSGTHATTVKLELDTYWAFFADVNPAELMGRLGTRVALLHCKDMTNHVAKRFAPVGAGVLNWSEIAREAETSGLDWLIVEQDDCYGLDPFAQIAESLENLRQMHMVQ